MGFRRDKNGRTVDFGPSIGSSVWSAVWCTHPTYVKTYDPSIQPYPTTQASKPCIHQSAAGVLCRSSRMAREALVGNLSIMGELGCWDSSVLSPWEGIGIAICGDPAALGGTWKYLKALKNALLEGACLSTSLFPLVSWSQQSMFPRAQRGFAIQISGRISMFTCWSLCSIPIATLQYYRRG
jgi:hypothetical protein